MKFVLAAGILVFGIFGAMALVLSASLAPEEALVVLIAAALASIMFYLLILLYF